jgi:hypothetical protein
LRGGRAGRERPIGQKSFPNTPDGIERAIAWVMKISKAEILEVHAILEPQRPTTSLLPASLLQKE